jgi:phage terminase large subunit-like protein
MIDAHRLRETPPHFERIVVGVDPAVTSGEDADETGILVAGMIGNRGYIVEDLSGQYTPQEWAIQAIKAYYKYNADRIVAEVNQGGDMVEHTIRTVDRNVSYKAVRAARGKMLRDEPIAALYEQGRIHHCGTFADCGSIRTGTNPPLRHVRRVGGSTLHVYARVAGLARPPRRARMGVDRFDDRQK